MSPYAMLQVTAATLCASLVLYWLVEAREGGRRARSRETLSAEGGFRLVLGSKYLRLIGLLLILLNLVNTTGEYILSRSVVAEAARRAASNPSFSAESYIGAFYGEYFFYVNLAAVIIQAFVVSRVVKYLGMPGALLALPVVSLGAYGSIAAGVGFAAIRWAKTAENPPITHHEHGPADALAPHDARREVQGQADPRHVFRESGRRSRRGAGVRRHALARPRRRRLRVDEPRPHRPLAGCRRTLLRDTDGSLVPDAPRIGAPLVAPGAGPISASRRRFRACLPAAFPRNAPFLMPRA
jgi:hypothetical protein